MNPGKRQSTKYEPPIPMRHASTPTANYVLTPKSLVCPGTFSRNVSKQWSVNQSRVQQKDSSKSSLKSPKIVVTPSTQIISPKSALVVSASQGVFEIHLKYLDLSDTGVERIENDFENAIPNIRISWKFLSFERSSMSLGKAADKHYPIESSVLYKIDINEGFFEYILTRELSLELYAKSDQKEKYLARGGLKLNDLLEYPTNELYAYVDLCDADKALVLSNTGIAIVYGTLTLWYRLSCDVDLLGNYLSRAGHIYYSASTSTTVERTIIGGVRKSSIATLQRYPDQRQSLSSKKASFIVFQLPEDVQEDSESINSLEPTDSEMESFKEALDLVLSRNKALRTTQSEISNELRDRARWLHEESNWKRTLQEYAILCGKDPATVEWRQWRDESTANVKLRKYPSQMVIYQPEVVITIQHLKLYKSSPPMRNNKLKKFYVEYNFLTHEGEETECPISIEKSSDARKMTFNFTKTFSLDPKENPKDTKKLAEAVKNAEEIKFAIVGEPEDEPSTSVCCEEVGSCVINMLELVQEEENEVTESFAISDPKDELMDIGYLKVRISGILAMRRLALQLLAPPDYTILE